MSKLSPTAQQFVKDMLTNKPESSSDEVYQATVKKVRSLSRLSRAEFHEAYIAPVANIPAPPEEPEKPVEAKPKKRAAKKRVGRPRKKKAAAKRSTEQAQLLIMRRDQRVAQALQKGDAAEVLRITTSLDEFIEGLRRVL